MSKKMYEGTLQTKKELLDDIMVWLYELLEPYEDCPRRTRRQICVACDELFTNICSYAYDPPDSGKVLVHAEIVMKEGRPMLILRFTDQGVPYNPLDRPDPDVTTGAEERGIGGWGIFMVKKSMDIFTYEYKDGSNIVTIGRYVDNAEAAEESS